MRVLVALFAVACGGGGTQVLPPGPVEGWPTENQYSWNGSWSPAAGDFPVAGLYDDVYFDGHVVDGNPSPVLPPGDWDWMTSQLANWRNFEGLIGSFEALTDGAARQYGWRLVGTQPIDYSGGAAYFEGSSGTDVIDLGAAGSIHSISGNLGDGPDVLVFNESYSLDFRTGSAGVHDDDLVVAGCDVNGSGAFDILTTTIHTGPGSDWVFARDLSRAGIDAGNGAGGRTDTLDAADGNDLVVFAGNTHDFRFFGGNGDDVAVWYVDENIQTETWLGPDFFGGGGAGAAVWDDTGTDRLVLVVPTDTVLVTSTPTPPGGLLVRGTDGTLILDDPTQGDPFAAYCVECGTSPTGRKTVIIEYVSADDSIHTGYTYLTSIEELQVGVGAGARVYRLDDVTGTATLDTATAFVPPSQPSPYCQ